VTLIVPEALLPGVGFVTLTAYIPAVGSDPFAVSWAEDT
jgi:hypothetical protein